MKSSSFLPRHFKKCLSAAKRYSKLTLCLPDIRKAVGKWGWIRSFASHASGFVLGDTRAFSTTSSSVGSGCGLWDSSSMLWEGTKSNPPAWGQLYVKPGSRCSGLLQPSLSRPPAALSLSWPWALAAEPPSSWVLCRAHFICSTGICPLCRRQLAPASVPSYLWSLELPPSPLCSHWFRFKASNAFFAPRPAFPSAFPLCK